MAQYTERATKVHICHWLKINNIVTLMKELKISRHNFYKINFETKGPKKYRIGTFTVVVFAFLWALLSAKAPIH